MKFHTKSKKTPLRITHGNSPQELKQNRPGLMRSFWEALFSDPQTEISLEIDPTNDVSRTSSIHIVKFIPALFLRPKDEELVSNKRATVLQSGLLAFLVLASRSFNRRTGDFLQSAFCH